MSKTINVDFYLKKDNSGIVDFSEHFLQDLKDCLKRFRLEVSLTDKKAVASDSFCFIFLSSRDLDDKKFISDIIPLADSQNTFLLSLDPIKTSDKSFPQHKFRIFNFWNEIKETGELRYFRRTPGSNNAQYWERITDLAIEIDKRDARLSGSKRGKVYLAQTDNAQSADRDNLARDLNERGFEVVPERMLSSDFNECTDQVKQLLDGCQLIIHPISLVYSKYFSDKQVSVVEHQSILSAQYAADKQHDVKRVIWIPSDFDISDEDNQIFVEKIQRDQDQKKNTMVLKVTLEELKKIYTKILSGELEYLTEENMPDVYVVGDNIDEFFGDKILMSNNDKGMTINNNFKGITYNQHLKYLANSEFVIINYTSDNEPWFMMKVNDIFKSKGIRASKPFKKLILVKESKDLDTSAFESRFSEVHVSPLKDIKLDLAVKNN